MARLPLWAKIERVGFAERGNMGVRLTMRWWAVPYLFLVAMWRWATGKLEDVPDECDGIEIVETRIG